jgi:polyhydroxyalkanoate synthesis regulator phasin
MDVIRRAVMLGIGVVSLTKDKAEEVVDDLIKRGEIASGERFGTVDTLLREAEKQERELERKITTTVQKVVAEMGLPTRKELDEILITLKRIENRISFPESKIPFSEKKDVVV